MTDLKKRKISLEDFEWGHFPVQEVMKLEGEAELVKGWQGLSPIAVLKQMALEYLQRFPDHLVPELDNKSHPKSHIQIWHRWIVRYGNNWSTIDRRLKDAARLCSERPEQLAFWDKMRYIARGIQPEHSRSIRKAVQRVQSRVDDGEYEIVVLDGIEYKVTDESKYIFQMGACRYCWRAAFKIPGHKYCYCHLCVKDSTEKKYISMHNNKNRSIYANKIRPNDFYMFCEESSSIYERCKPSTLIRISINTGGNKYKSGYLALHKAWEHFPGEVLKLFPYVLKHLANSKVNIDSTSAIVEALEYPPPKNEESKTKANVRNVHYLTCSFDYDIYVEHLIWAEIWLKYEAEQPKHGGARKGAGRPRKAIEEAAKVRTESGEK